MSLVTEPGSYLVFMLSYANCLLAAATSLPFRPTVYGNTMHFLLCDSYVCARVVCMYLCVLAGQSGVERGVYGSHEKLKEGIAMSRISVV